MRSKVLTVSVVVLVLAGCAIGAYFFLNIDFGKALIGKQPSVVIDYTDDDTTVEPKIIELDPSMD